MSHAVYLFLPSRPNHRNMRPFPAAHPLISTTSLLPTPNLSILSSLRTITNKPTTTTAPITYRQLLQTCVSRKNLVSGAQVHAGIVTHGLQFDSFLSTQLVTLYSVCGCLPIAVSVFSQVEGCNVYLLNAMIRGYVSNGSHEEAVGVFYRKFRDGLGPDSYSFSCVLKACGFLTGGLWGREVHGLAVHCGLDCDLFVSNSLVSMYANCGRVDAAVRVFDGMAQPDVVSWNSVVAAYVQNGFGLDAMVRVEEMIRSGLRPDMVTIFSVLSVCCSEEAIRGVHCYIVKNGLEHIPNVQTSLISTYGRHGMVREAQWLFDNSEQAGRASWNALISCHARLGLFEESLELLRKMKLSGSDADIVTYSGIISSFAQNDRSSEALVLFRELLGTGMKLDAITLSSVLPAISDLQCLAKCKGIHAYSLRHGLASDRRVRNALVSAYCRCGEVTSSSLVFLEIRYPDVISWSSMVAGYVQNGYHEEALDIFRQMMKAKIKPNPITITSILSTCAGISGLKQGKEVHSWAVKNVLEDQTFVGSAVIDMYAKCGEIKASRIVFDHIKEKNVVTWNSMIGGYAVHGLAESAIEIFQSMEEKDEVSFIVALSACSHGGLIEEGIEIFNSMKDLNVKPKQKHYACMIDILARSGRLDQAFDLVKSMPMEVSTEIWGSLLGACKVHSNLEIGLCSGEQIIGGGLNNSGHHVLVSNLLADFGRWEDVEVMREMMGDKGVKKVVGCSWIELDQRVHSFVARNRANHPEWCSVFRVLKVLDEQMKTIS